MHAQQAIERRQAEQQSRVMPRGSGVQCFYCLQFFTPDLITRDHFIPRAKGGTLLRNKVSACGPCNQSKGSRMPTESEVLRFHRTFGYWPMH